MADEKKKSEQHTTDDAPHASPFIFVDEPTAELPEKQKGEVLSTTPSVDDSLEAQKTREALLSVFEQEPLVPAPSEGTVPEKQLPFTEQAASLPDSPASSCPRCDTALATTKEANCQLCGFVLPQTKNASEEETCVVATIKQRRRTTAVCSMTLGSLALLCCLISVGVIGVASKLLTRDMTPPEQVYVETIAVTPPPSMQRRDRQDSQRGLTSTERIQAFIDLVKARQGVTQRTESVRDSETTPEATEISTDSFALDDMQLESLFPDFVDRNQEDMFSYNGLWSCSNTVTGDTRITNNPSTAVDVRCRALPRGSGSYNKLAEHQTATWR